MPVPKVVLTVLEPDLLGAAFFVMERAHGRVPGDVPSWHQKGWTVDLSPGDRARMHDAALESLVALHQIEPGDGFSSGRRCAKNTVKSQALRILTSSNRISAAPKSGGPIAERAKMNTEDASAAA